jgi:hypothetical protein
MAGEAGEEGMEAVPETPREEAPEATADWIPEAAPEEEVFPETAAAPAPAASAAYEEGGGDEILRAELKEQFAARAEAIFREVASEAVEKVMWEMMDRLAGEFSARIRESVESVAWEVIPATAEALIGRRFPGYGPRPESRYLHEGKRSRKGQIDLQPENHRGEVVLGVALRRVFHAHPHRPGEPYTIVIPPPNVTGSLHMGTP